ncbi:MAG TPA: carbohydrate-binding protein [Ktedonobacterales bacterium]|nr:carbohydrate-binding protein [Ktedonobacterales bacterium]
MQVEQKEVIITYKKGLLLRGADTLTVHWSGDNWGSVTDTPMTRESDGSWRAKVTLPVSISTLNMAFFNQSGVWDNNGGRNYNLAVSEH